MMWMTYFDDDNYFLEAMHRVGYHDDEGKQGSQQEWPGYALAANKCQYSTLSCLPKTHPP